ncbi:hypothetical protein DFQ30_010080 [Apophysomyces sp. BC1015]|nr:hypothetical protein DFQ30_010080 [Apophysomyces sp. BC1015]
MNPVTYPISTSTLSDTPVSINTQPISSPEVHMEDILAMTAKERAAQDIAELMAQRADLTAQMASAALQGNIEAACGCRGSQRGCRGAGTL